MGLFHPDEKEADHFLQKQLEGTQLLLMSSADRVAHIDGQPMQLLWSTYTMRFQRSINAQSNKPSNPFTNVCWVSVLTTFSAPPKFWLHRQFLLPNSRNEE